MTTKIKHINPAVTPTVAGIVATSVSQFTDVNIPDNNAIRFGNSQDLQIYHNGSNSYIDDVGTGALNIRSSGIYLEKFDGSEVMASFLADGAAALYHNGSPKLTTDSAGINVTGGIDVADITATGNVSLNSDGGTLYLGAGADLRLYHNATNSVIDNQTGVLYIDQNENNGNLILRADDGSGGLSEYIVIDGGSGSTKLKHYGSTKIETTSAGGTVTGTLTVTGDLDITGNVNSSSVTDLDVTDKTITVGAGQTEAASGGSGLIVDGSNASILWDETSDKWDFNKSLHISGGSGTGVKIDSGGAIVGGGASGGDTQLMYWGGGPVYYGRSSLGGTVTGHEFRVGGVTKLNVNSSGNVKIGSSTTSGARLSVTGTSSGSSNPGIFQIGTDTTMGTGTNMMTMGVDNDSHVWIQGTKPGHDARNIILQPAGLVNTNAYVGIGVTDPSAALHIQTATNDTNSAVPSIMITNLSSGTTTTGFGGEIRFQAQRNNGVNQNTGGIRSVAEVNAGTNISSGLAFDVGTAGVNDEALRIKYNGNVGIGTTAPDRGLTIDRSNEFAAINIIKNNTTNQIAYMGTGSSGATDNGIIQLSDSGTVKAQIYTTGDSYFNGGNVGIGVTNPVSKLHVVGGDDADGSIRFQQTAATNNPVLFIEQIGQGGNSNTNQGLLIKVDGQNGGYGNIIRAIGTNSNLGADIEAFTVKNSGKVGIGVTAPTELLHIKNPSNTWNAICQN